MARPSRLPTVTYKGPREYFVTTCADRRRSHFDRPAVVDMTRLHFLRSADRTGVEISAYCFMPDHLHLLVTAVAEAGDLDRFMRLAKQASGYAFIRLDGGRLWQTGYHERILRADEAALICICYMVANPIRAGLVRRAEPWPHWGSARYTRDEILDAISLRG